jgi:hypothetical protein
MLSYTISGTPVNAYEGIALGACDQQLLQWHQAGVVSQERLEHPVSAGRRQRVEPQLRVNWLRVSGTAEHS